MQIAKKRKRVGNTLFLRCYLFRLLCREIHIKVGTIMLRPNFTTTIAPYKGGIFILLNKIIKNQEYLYNFFSSTPFSFIRTIFSFARVMPVYVIL